MSVQRTFTCDEGECERHVKTQAEQPPAFLTVREEAGRPHEARSELHFCSWDCLLKHAATFEPSETHPFEPGDLDRG